MALSQETVKAIMAALKAEFDFRLDVQRNLGYWHQRLKESGMTDDNAGEIRHRFVQGRRTSKPNLNEFAQFARQEAQAMKPPPAYREPPVRSEENHAGFVRRLRRIQGRFKEFAKKKRVPESTREPKTVEISEDNGRREKLREQAERLKGLDDVPEDQIPF